MTKSGVSTGTRPPKQVPRLLADVRFAAARALDPKCGALDLDHAEYHVRVNLRDTRTLKFDPSDRERWIHVTLTTEWEDTEVALAMVGVQKSVVQSLGLAGGTKSYDQSCAEFGYSDGWSGLTFNACFVLPLPEAA